MATTPTKAWTRLLGSSGPDQSTALTTGLDGSIYVSGYSNGSLDGQANNGGTDGFVTKYNVDGTKAWTRLLGSSADDQNTALTTGLDGAIYVSGYTNGSLDGKGNSGGADAFLTKYAIDGTKIWTRVLGTTGSDQALALTTGTDGSIYVSGFTSGSLDGQTNKGSMDAFVTKYTVDGTKVWSQLLGTSTYAQALALTTGLDGSIYVGGFTSGALDLQANSGSMDAFVTKYTQDGAKVWSRLIGTSSYDQANALTTGLDGSIYVSGYTYGALDGQANSGGADAFITKYSADGTKVWTRLVGTTGYEQSNALTTGLDGSIYLSGYTYSSLDGQTNAGSMDALVTKFSPDGTKVWTRLLGTSGADQALGLTTGLEGAIYVSGYTSAALDGQANSGGVDAFLAKYQDLATIPSFALNAVSSYVDEGSNAAFVLNTSNLPAGTALGYFLSGTGITSSDIATGQLSGTAVVDASGKATIFIPIAADQTKEGQETVTLAIQGVSASTVINDTSIPPVPGYFLTPASSAVNEGTAAIFYVTTNNVPTGTSVPYTLSGVGISSGDFSGGQLSGSVVIDGSGRATISIPIASDGATEGPETLIVSAGGKTAVTLINDTGIVKIGTSGTDTLSGSVGSDTIDGGAGIDTVFFSANQNTYTLNRGANAWTLSSVAEGADILTNVERLHFADLSVALDLGFNQAAGQTALLLGAVLPGKLALDPSKQQLMGTVIGLFDAGYSLTDLAGALLRLDIWSILTGSNSKQAIASYLLNNINGVAPDSKTLADGISALTAEPVQGTWLATLAGGSAGQSHIGLSTLASTGLPYLAPENLSAGTANVDEGRTASFLFTSYLPAGSSLSYTLSGNGITGGDIVGGALTGSTTVGTFGQATVSVGIAGDGVTEGPETLVITSRGLSASVIINDTYGSIVPTYTLTAGSTSVNEGQTATINVTTTNLTSGTVIPYSLSGAGIMATDIVGGQLSGTVTLSANGTATISVPIATDSLVEGPETLVVTVAGKTVQLLVNDTTDPGARTYFITSDNPSVYEGGVAIFTVNTSNVSPGSVIAYSLSGIGVTPSDIVGGQLSGTVTIGANGNGSILIPIAADYVVEGPEILNVSLADKTAQVVVFDYGTGAATYQILPAAAKIDPADSMIVTLKTTNVLPGTHVPYTLTVQASLIAGPTSGEFIVDATGSANIIIATNLHQNTDVMTINVFDQHVPITLVGRGG